MSDNRLNDSIQSLLSGLDGFLSTRMVVGEPVRAGESLILPLMDVEIGVGAGSYGGKSSTTAGGMGAKVSPSAVLILQNGAVKLVSVKNQDTVTRILDMVPDVLDRLSGKLVKSDPDLDKAVEEILNEEK
ncbi:MAG: sporulation protein [Lachnospiraceae bacterium]|nr:sporulation protein [Lachnospiraceae bacterium]